MKKLLLLAILTLLAVVPVFGATEFLSVTAQERSVLSLATKDTQEFISFPQELYYGQQFRFCTDYLRTWEEAYNVQLMYEFYQDGRFIAHKAIDLTTPGEIISADTRFEGCMNLRFDADLFATGAVEVRGFLFGNKAKTYGPANVGIISQVDVKSFSILPRVDCSDKVGRCSQDGTGVVTQARTADSNDFCIIDAVKPCASNVCKDRFIGGDLQGYCEAPTCVPETNPDGSKKLTQYGDACSSTVADTCGNTFQQPQDGKSCGTSGTCQNGNCINTCNPTKSGRVEACITYNECNDVLRVKPDGVACVPDASMPTSGGYACSAGKCVVDKADPLPQCNNDEILVNGNCIKRDNDPDCKDDEILVDGICTKKDTNDCLIDDSPRTGNVRCCSIYSYLVNDEVRCGPAPTGHCTSDATCGTGKECVDNFCKSMPVPLDETCTQDLEQSCSDGSTIITAICQPDSEDADSQGLVNTDERCPDASACTNDELSGSGCSPHDTRDSDERRDTVEPTERTTYGGFIFLGILVLLMFGVVYVILNRD